MSLQGKRGKRGSLLPASGLIALGGNSKRDSVDESRKRDATSAFSTESSSSSGRNSGGEAKQPKLSEADAADLASQLVSLVSDVNGLVPKLIESLKLFSTSRVSPSESLYASFLYVFKELDGHNLLTTFPNLMKAITDLLREPSSNVKQRPSNATVLLACNLLMHSFRNVEVWPLSLLRLFIDDYLGDRVWTEGATGGSSSGGGSTSEFVHHLLSAFTTNLPPSFSDSTGAQKPKLFIGGGPSAVSSLKEESRSPIGSPSQLPSSTDYPNHYSGLHVEIGRIITEVANDVLSKKPLADVTLRSLLHLLAISCGIPQVRLFASAKLDLWLHNTKLLKPAQDLFASVCLNCSGEATGTDNDVLANLVRLKPKTKIVSGIVSHGLKEMLNAHPDISQSLVKNIVFNEFSGVNRNPNNMNLLTHLFQNNLEETSKNIAHAFQIVLYQKDDYTKAVRTFFREIIKAQRHEVRFKTFCLALLDTREEVSSIFDSEKLPVGKYFSHIVDVATYAVLISIPPVCRELYTSRLKREERDNSTLIRIQGVISQLFSDFIEWLKNNAVHLHQEYFCSLIQRLLFFDPLDAYFRQDAWPQDQSVCYRIVTECVTLESTISNLILFGLEPSFPVSAPDVLNFIEILVTRSPGTSVIIANEKDLFTGLFNLAVYTKPASIVLPVNYKQPQLAVASLLWKVWTVLTVLAGSNTETVAKLGWMHYPSLKMFMEMALTSDFAFPPSTSQLNRESLKLYEIQTREQERQEVINFECLLAGKTITAENSILATQLVFIDPMNLPRQPSNDFLIHLKNICTSLKVGSALCSSRNTDYLLDILQRNQSLSGMAWLSQIILTSDIQNLPPQCLCEYLLSEMTRDSSAYDRSDKVESIKCYLRNLIQSPDSASDYVLQVLRYFFTAMCSCENFFKRKAAGSALLSLLSDSGEVQPDMIFQLVGQLSCFEAFSPEMNAFALQTFSFEFELPLIVSAFFYLITNLPQFSSQQRTNVILFSETFCRRSEVILQVLKLYPEIKPMLGDFVAVITDIFLDIDSQKNVPDNWLVLEVKSKYLTAPREVIAALYGLFVLSEDAKIQDFALSHLSLQDINTILPSWVKAYTMTSAPLVFCRWIERASIPSDLFDMCLIFGLSPLLKEKLRDKMESFSLSDIKASLKEFRKKFLFVTVSDYGAKFECAYTSVVPQPSTRKTIVINEIDEMDVDVAKSTPTTSIPLSSCQTVGQWTTFISESMVLSNNFCEDVVKLCDDHTLLAEAVVEIISRQYSIFDTWASEQPGEFNGFVMSVSRSLRFNWLNRWYNDLVPLLENTSHGKCLKFMKRYIDDEEIKMQPKSPEPEVRVSLRAKSLLDAGKPKIGSITGRKISLTGKTLDLLKTSDPEIVKKHVDYLWKVIFSADHDLSAYHCCLLSLLVHTSNWSTLNDCVYRIIAGMSEDTNVKINPTAVLDFLTALHIQPRLFQGRDSALLSKSPSAVMTLEVNELCKLVDIIADEGRHLSEESLINQLQTRIILLLRFTDKRCVNTIQKLLHYCRDNIQYENVNASIIMLIYLNTAIPLPEKHSKTIDSVSTEVDNSFNEDCLMHNIFLPISSPTCTKESMQLAACIVLKFASMHPLFMNRQIELISVLLQGRSRSSWTAFRKEGHADLYRLCLRVLLRLTPRVFKHEKFPMVMNCMLETYSVFQGLTNELFRESRKLLFDVIDSMFENDVELTVNILQPHVSFIANYPVINKHLLNVLRIDDAEFDPNSQSAPLIVNTQFAASEITRCRKFLTGFKNLRVCYDEVVNILKVLEDLSHKRVKQLDVMIEPLGRLLLLRNPEIVEKTLSVLLSISKHVPSISSEVSTAFVKAITTKGNPNTSRLLAYASLDKMLCCCSDNGVTFLTAVFDAAIFEGLPLDEQLKTLVSGQTLENILRQDKL